MYFLPVDTHIHLHIWRFKHCFLLVPLVDFAVGERCDRLHMLNTVHENPQRQESCSFCLFLCKYNVLSSSAAFRRHQTAGGRGLQPTSQRRECEIFKDGQQPLRCELVITGVKTTTPVITRSHLKCINQIVLIFIIFMLSQWMNEYVFGHFCNLLF